MGGVMSAVENNALSGISRLRGKVHLVIDLPSTHQFAPNIREEIQEKIGHLWDVKQVDIEFTD